MGKNPLFQHGRGAKHSLSVEGLAWGKWLFFFTKWGTPRGRRYCRICYSSNFVFANDRLGWYWWKNRGEEKARNKDKREGRPLGRERKSRARYTEAPHWGRVGPWRPSERTAGGHSGGRRRTTLPSLAQSLPVTGNITYANFLFLIFFLRNNHIFFWYSLSPNFNGKVMEENFTNFLSFPFQCLCFLKVFMYCIGFRLLV